MIYTYRCQSGHEFDLFRHSKDADKKAACDLCGSAARRIISRSVRANTGAGCRIPGVCHTLPGGPKYIQSKHHWREELKKLNKNATPIGLE